MTDKNGRLEKIMGLASVASLAGFAIQGSEGLAETLAEIGLEEEAHLIRLHVQSLHAVYDGACKRLEILKAEATAAPDTPPEGLN